jgi:TatD DNase family protein
MSLIDTHTHIYLPDFAPDRDAMIARGHAAGVSDFLLPNIDVDSLDDLFSLKAAYPKEMHMMMGLHPCSVKADFQSQLSKLKALLFANPEEYIGVGEIGLDLYWDASTLTNQQVALKEQLQWARALNKPFAIHCRNAFDALFDLLDEVLVPEMSGVLHCFTGTEQDVEKALKHPRLYFGIGGVLTYKNSGLDKVMAAIPRNRVILETDAPYLTPVPHRGKRNEPAYVALVAQKLAEVWEASFEEVAHLTTQNAKALFKL